MPAKVNKICRSGKLILTLFREYSDKKIGVLRAMHVFLCSPDCFQPLTLQKWFCALDTRYMIETVWDGTVPVDHRRVFFPS
jgi:hypothetical protein